MKTSLFMILNYPYLPDGVIGTGCSEADIAWIEASRTAFNPVDHAWPSAYAVLYTDHDRYRDGTPQ
jgi:hypothetical protein